MITEPIQELIHILCEQSWPQWLIIILHLWDCHANNMDVTLCGIQQFALMKYIILVVLFLYLLYKMVTSCSAYGCTARRKKDSGISFHRFPVNHSELYRKWVQAVADNFVPTEDCFICSKHFTNNCFKATKARRRLWNDAVHLFFQQFPLYMQKKETKRKSPKKRKFIDPSVKQGEPSPSKVQKSIELDHPYIIKTEKEKERVQRKSKLQKKVKSLTKKVERRDKRIRNLTDFWNAWKTR